MHASDIHAAAECAARREQLTQNAFTVLRGHVIWNRRLKLFQIQFFFYLTEPAIFAKFILFVV